MIRKLIYFLLLLSGISFAQQQSPQQAGIFYASAYYSGQGFLVKGNTVTGSTSVIIAGNSAGGGVQLIDGTTLPINIFFSLSALSPLTFEDANLETVTPTSVTIAPCPPSNISAGGSTLCATVTGNFTKTHGQMVVVKSGTFGLQEAINVATNSGGGIVLVDSSWGGTTSMITGASGNTTVGIQDNRSGQIVQYQWTGTAYAASVPGTPGVTLTLAVAPNAINFNSVQINTDSPSQPVTITNTGNATALITSAAISGSSDFRAPLINACNGNLPPLQSCSIPVLLHPTISSTEPQTTLTINSNAHVDPTNPTNTVTLNGSGTALATFPVSVNSSGTGGALIASGENPPAISCNILPPAANTGACSNNYASGASVTLTATPNPGSTFVTWSGVAGCTTSPVCTFTVSSATTVNATFNLTPVSVTLNLTGAGGGNGSVTSDVSSTNGILNCASVGGVTASGGNQGCSGPYPQGTVVTLTESPGVNSTFAGWSGACSGSTATTCQVPLNSNQTVTANFAGTTVIPITLVQSTTNCAVSGATIACNWGNAMNVGDTYICAIGFPDASSTVSSIADTKTNTITQVPTISPKVGTGLTQAVYYAQNIAAATAGANTTTATLSSSVSGIAGTALTTGTSGGGATATTASVTLTNNNLILIYIAAVLVSGNGPGAISSVIDTGCGLTWVKVASVNYGGTEGTGTSERMELWRTLGNGSTCTITATWGVSVSAKLWTVSKFSGVNTGGTSGSAAVGISATSGNNGLGSPASTTMGTFGSASNGTSAATAMGSQPASVSAGSGMTLLNQQNKMQDEFAAGNISPVQFTWSDGTTPSWGIIGIEIVAASAGRRDMRCAEYSGILQSGSPIDTSAAALGTSATAAPGSITPAAAGELLTDFNLSTQFVLTPATGYTQRIKNTFGDDLEDIEGATTSATNPSVALSTSGNWVASNVAWKPQTGSAPTSFSVTVLGGAGNGAGTVTSNSGSPNLNCPIPSGPTGACSSLVSSGSTDTLTAVASAGSVFVGWGGVTGCSTSANCQIPNITSSATVSATFNLSGTQNYYVNATTGSNSRTGLCAVAGTPAGCDGPWQTWAQGASAGIGASGTVVHFAGTSGSPQTYLAAPTANCGAVGQGTFCVTHGGTSTAQFVLQCDNGLFGAAGSSGNPGPCQLRSSSDVANQQILGTSAASYVTIQGFDIGGDVTHPATLEQSGIQMYTKDGTGLFMNISYNYVHDLGRLYTGNPTEGTGCPQQGLIAYDTGFPFTAGRNGTDGTFIGNFLNNGGDITNVNCNQMHGLYIGAGPRMKVQNNIVGNVPGSGIKMYIANCQSVVSNNLVFHTGWWGILVADAGDGVCAAQGVSPIGLTTVSNNELVNTGFNKACGAIAEASGSGTNLYANNLFISTLVGIQNPLFPVVNCSTTPIPSPSVVSGTNSTATLATTFVSYADNGTGNYQSPASGQAVNTGTTQCIAGGVQSCTPLIAIDGTVRPQGTAIDRGPYEQ